MASTPNTKPRRPQVTYGRSARKRISTGVSSPETISSPATPRLQPNGNRPRDRQLSTSTIKRADSSQVGKDSRWAGRHEAEHKVARQRGDNPGKLSLKPIKARASNYENHANVYDIPSSDDERSPVDASRRKRRKIGALGERESPPTPVTLPHRQPPPDLPEPSPKKRSLQNNVTTPKGISNEPTSARVEVVIEQKERTSTGKHNRRAPLTSRKSTEESQETSTKPASRPSSTPTDQSHPSRIKEQTTPEKADINNRRKEYRELFSSQSVDRTVVAPSPGRRRLVDGLNINGSDLDEPLTSPIGNSRKSPSLSRSLSKSSPAPQNPKDNEPSLDDHRQSESVQTQAPSQNSQGIGPRITYARQRSFLSEANMIENPGQLEVPDSQPFGGRDRDMIPPLNAKPVPMESDDETGVTTSGAVRSIHELRQAGGNARFQGMVDSMFEEFEDDLGSVSSRRGGLIQLCGKLTDYQFARQFLENGLEKRLATFLKNQVDVLSSSLGIYACALLLSTGPVSSTTLSACCSVILAVTPLLLGEEQDIKTLSRNRRMKSSRVEQASLQDLCAQSLKSKIWADKPPTQVSPQILTLRCLEMAVRKVREKGELLEIISGPALDQLVGILLWRTDELRTTPASGDNLIVLELVFSILESYTVEMSSLDPGQELTIKRLSQLGPFLSYLTKQDDAQSRHLQILNIRLILNVTNNNQSLCEDFATSALVEALVEMILSKFGLVSEEFIGEGEKREPVLDIVILALGTLINLTEWSETSRVLVLKAEKDSTAFIDSLLRLFTNGLDAIAEADSVAQTHINVAFGYLSVLLSTLCLNDEARSHVRHSFPERNLDKLLATVEEFLCHYRKVEELELHHSDHEEDPMAEFTSRLQGIVNRIKDLERGR